MTLTEKILAQIPGNPLNGLRNADRLWQSYREGTVPTTPVVTENTQLLDGIEFDVVICGGTLGIFLATALVNRGWKVAVIERGLLKGRDQEWNISRHELQVLTQLGLLTTSELEATIAIEFNPVRLSFHKGAEFWVEDILNIGVNPVDLLETLKSKFLKAGGQLLENTAFEQAIVYPNGIALKLRGCETVRTGASGQGGNATFQSIAAQPNSPNPTPAQSPFATENLTTRLLLDAMGHFSPIARQARNGQQPDAVCLVVGTCATGFPANQTGDLMASITPIENHCQYFWEAFPARDGRTTYLFTYVDADPNRSTLTNLFEDYFRLLPDYQSVELAHLQFHRALFGFFPCYRQSPLSPRWDRVLSIGDSAGGQSPLSFGGFGALLRHLGRLTRGIDAALSQDLLTRPALATLQPYQPNLAVTWLFQRSMSVRVKQTLPPDQINQLLSVVFQAMSELGDPILRPFLQDVVQFPALFRTLMRVSVQHPFIVLKIIPQVGMMALLEWVFHYVNLGLYALLNWGVDLGRSLLSPMQKYTFERWCDAWQYGSGSDYSLSKDDR